MNFEYVLPALRGIQAGREYYVSMCPLRYLPKLLPLPEAEIPPEKRAGRVLNRQRVAEIAQYMVEGAENYSLSSLSVAIDGDITFEEAGTEGDTWKIGRLRVPMDAQMTLNDGQHRRAAVEMALREKPELGYETIALIFFLDVGLERNQQRFHDLNNYAVRPEGSLNILYNSRNEESRRALAVMQGVPILNLLTEKERVTLHSRSPKLFTLQALYQATVALLAEHQAASFDQKVELAKAYWTAVCEEFPLWQQVAEGRVSAAEVRQDYLHCQALQTLGEVGNLLLARYPQDWRDCLQGLGKINWLRSNPDWEGVLIQRGQVAKSQASLDYLRGYVLRSLGLPLQVSSDKESIAVS